MAMTKVISMVLALKVTIDYVCLAGGNGRGWGSSLEALKRLTQHTRKLWCKIHPNCNLNFTTRDIPEQMIT